MATYINEHATKKTVRLMFILFLQHSCMYSSKVHIKIKVKIIIIIILILHSCVRAEGHGKCIQPELNNFLSLHRWTRTLQRKPGSPLTQLAMALAAN